MEEIHRRISLPEGRVRDGMLIGSKDPVLPNAAGGHSFCAHPERDIRRGTLVQGQLGSDRKHVETDVSSGRHGN